MKCIKKAVEITAMQLTKDNVSEVLKFCKNNAFEGTLDPSLKDSTLPKSWVTVKTLEGECKANYGDYIIKGVEGEFYPCLEETFNKIYIHKKGKKYEKKPIEQECIFLNKDNQMDVIDFCIKNNVERPIIEKENLLLKNNDSLLIATPGDFVLIGPSGNAYPCKRDIFFKTFDISIPDWLSNVQKEEAELGIKIDVLNAALVDEDLTAGLRDVDPEHLILLSGQLGAMMAYRNYLILRMQSGVRSYEDTVNYYKTVKFNKEKDPKTEEGEEIGQE